MMKIFAALFLGCGVYRVSNLGQIVPGSCLISPEIYWLGRHPLSTKFSLCWCPYCVCVLKDMELERVQGRITFTLPSCNLPNFVQILYFTFCVYRTFLYHITFLKPHDVQRLQLYKYFLYILTSLLSGMSHIYIQWNF